VTRFTIELKREAAEFFCSAIKPSAVNFCSPVNLLQRSESSAAQQKSAAKRFRSATLEPFRVAGQSCRSYGQ
jgi:hypothetical protein